MASASPLYALGDGESGGNDVNAFAASPSFLRNSYRSSNYWLDVAFQSGC